MLIMTRLMWSSSVLLFAELRLPASDANIAPIPSSALSAGDLPPASALQALEAAPQKTWTDPGYWTWATGTQAQLLRLIEGNALSTGDDFYRASKLVVEIDGAYRAARLRHELLLSAAAKGHAEAEKSLGTSWDELMHGLGRAYRMDFTGLAARDPENFSLDLAPECIRAVFRDPLKARAAAATVSRNEEVKALVNADQKDRRVDWGKLSEEERKAIFDRDRARNRRIREIITAGELRTAADFANAALVMQHSSTFAGFQLAHELAVCSMLLGDRAVGRWLIAATYDRMLGSVGHDQRFGTQFMVKDGNRELVRIDVTGIGDAERTALGCPTLEQARNPGQKAESAEALAKRLADFTRKDRTIRIGEKGSAGPLPERWKLVDAKTWGDQQNTLFFDVEGQPESHPALYYRVFSKPRKLDVTHAAEFMRIEVEKKQASRRESIAGYTNRPGSFEMLDLDNGLAARWIADFESPNGDKWAESFVRVATEQYEVQLFIKGPVDQVEALQGDALRFMQSLKL